ncbi:U6 snRNA-associated Sm-like protein [Blastocladiella emersonii ATCC 22665]|nr:U6 snRNA-associated Sm-like protein [Blastocladiella emersonii ATCC 22665]
MDSLQDYLNDLVQVITRDGKVLVGKLRGFDQLNNLILEKCEERVYSEDAGMVRVPRGTFLMRGDQIVLVGGIDEAKEETIDYTQVKAKPIAPAPN